MSMNFPPIDFPIYGLTTTWGWRRWLDTFEAQQGQPTGGVWLGHGDTFRPIPGRKWAQVATLSRKRRLDPDDGLDARFVSEAAWRLIVLTLPHIDGYDIPTQSCSNEAQTAAASFADWPVVPWMLDGQEVSAHVWRRAGCWVGVVLDLPQEAVMVFGHWFEPESVVLSTVRSDDLSYGFDPDEPLEYFDTIETSRNAAFTADDIVHVPWPRHPDHDQLLKASD